MELNAFLLLKDPLTQKKLQCHQKIILVIKKMSWWKGFLIFLMLSLCVSSEESMQMQYDYLKVPASEFVGSIDTIVEVISQVTSILSEFADFSGDSRLQDAVSDCLDLLDVSSDELSWSAYASQNPNGTYI